MAIYVINFDNLFNLFDQLVGTNNKSKKFSTRIELEQIINALVVYCTKTDPKECYKLFKSEQLKLGTENKHNWHTVFEGIENLNFDIYSKANSMGNMCKIPQFDSKMKNNKDLKYPYSIGFILELLYKSRNMSIEKANPIVYNLYSKFKESLLEKAFPKCKDADKIKLYFDLKDKRVSIEDYPNLGEKPFSDENWEGIIEKSDTEKAFYVLKKSAEFKRQKMIASEFSERLSDIEVIKNRLEKNRSSAYYHEQKLSELRLTIKEDVMKLHEHTQVAEKMTEITTAGINTLNCHKSSQFDFLNKNNAEDEYDDETDEFECVPKESDLYNDLAITSSEDESENVMHNEPCLTPLSYTQEETLTSDDIDNLADLYKEKEKENVAASLPVHLTISNTTTTKINDDNSQLNTLTSAEEIFDILPTDNDLFDDEFYNSAIS